MSLATLFSPELRAVPTPQRRELLRRARRNPFDVLELLGMAMALIAAVLLAQAGLVPLAAAAAGAMLAPFFVRRTRRGLRRMLGRA